MIEERTLSKAIRCSLGLSPYEFSKKIGVDHYTYEVWERGTYSDFSEMIGDRLGHILQSEQIRDVRLKLEILKQKYKSEIYKKLRTDIFSYSRWKNGKNIPGEEKRKAINDLLSENGIPEINWTLKRRGR